MPKRVEGKPGRNSPPVSVVYGNGSGRSLRAIADDLSHDGVRLSHAGIRKIIASAVRDDLGEREIDHPPAYYRKYFHDCYRLRNSL